MKVLVKSFSRAYKTNADRKRAIKAFIRHGYDYFVCYMDTNGPIALQYGKKAWNPGQVYVNR